MGCDILAIQEAKVQRAKLHADPAASAAHPFGDWESFWATPATEGGGGKPSSAKRGFNGVTTFARRGYTLAADANPLGDPSLDGEGRCLLTDHGGFVLLNVYAHATGEGEDYRAKLQRKLRFFDALRAKMAQLRATGRRVILCGDLNVAARGADVPWKQALLPMGSLRLAGWAPGEACAIEETGDVGGAGALGEADCLPADTSGAASQAVARLHAALGGTEATRTLARRLRRRVGSRSTLPASWVLREVRSMLCGLADEEEEGEGDGAAEEAGGDGGDGGGGDGSGGGGSGGGGDGGGDGGADEVGVEDCAAHEGAGGALTTADTTSTEQAAALTAATEALATCAHWLGGSSSQRDCVAWMRALTSDDGMCDTFASCRPAARARFTCWNTYTNQRYVNVGKRIDYFLVDAPLAEHMLTGAPLAEDDTDAGARRAVTARGRWLPAPMRGADASLQEASMATHDTQFLPGRHTGIYYTAPPASDHVAVSLLLRAEALGRPRSAAPPQRERDAATKACSFRPQVGLKSFFAPKAKQTAASGQELPTATGGGGASCVPEEGAVKNGGAGGDAVKRARR